LLPEDERAGTISGMSGTHPVIPPRGGILRPPFRTDETFYPRGIISGRLFPGLFPGIPGRPYHPRGIISGRLFPPAYFLNPGKAIFPRTTF